MTLKQQIIRTFGIFAVAVSVLIGSIYYGIYTTNYKDMLFAQMNERAAVSSQQMSDIVQQMSLAYQVLLSDQDILQAIQKLARADRENLTYETLYFSNTYSTIRTGINASFVNDNFYRMIYFNQCGDVVAGENTPGDSVKSSVTYENLEWLDRVSAGTQVLIGCHVDDWGRNGSEVISLVRGLVGTNMGYIEVQWLKEDLDQYLAPESLECTVLFYNQEGELLYSYGDVDENIAYFSYLDGESFADLHETITEKGIFGGHILQDRTLLVSHYDSENGIVAVVAMNMDMSGLLLQAVPLMLLIVFAFLAAGLCYVVISSRRITGPIIHLRQIMEKTQLENLSQPLLPEKKDLRVSEELNILYESYFQVLERLSTSIAKEKQLSMLQLEAQFGLLQAQVNPHFLYNILNVISMKGIMANDESICEICAALSRMLRYSTNTKEESATIREEAEYLRTYLQLMKFRYEDRLSYEIVIPEEIQDVIIPKVTLEQIVENSFHHGFEGRTGKICISVSGWADENGWRVCIHDNGSGFTPEKIRELYARFGEVRQKLSQDRQFIRMEIGGMGLANVYARLYLELGEALMFTLDSHEQGAMVTIGVGRTKEPVQAEAKDKGGAQDV